MSKKYLGETFDIHGGGQDLIFPHHENEIAQSEGANCKPFVNSWIHHGFVTIRDEKMSKSLGNFLTIRDILDNYHPEVLRFFIFSTHYRNPLDFSEAAMQDATTGLVRLYECVAAVDNVIASNTDDDAATVFIEKDLNKLDSLEERFQQAMDNDFNTAQAQGVFFDTIKTMNKVRTKLSEKPRSSDIAKLKSSVQLLKKLAAIMGLLQEDATTYLLTKKQEMLSECDIEVETIEAFIAERKQCRIDKNWSRSDEIRDELLAKNIELKDGADGTTWIVKSN